MTLTYFKSFKNHYRGVIFHNEFIMAAMYIFWNVNRNNMFITWVSTWDAYIRTPSLDSLQKRTLKANLNAICFRVGTGSVDLALPRSTIWKGWEFSNYLHLFELFQFKHIDTAPKPHLNVEYSVDYMWKQKFGSVSYLTHNLFNISQVPLHGTPRK